MGVICDFYNSDSFFPEKVMKFALGLFLNEISNFPPFYFSGETSSGYKNSTLKNYGGPIDMSA